MMDEQFGQLLMAGAEALEAAITPAHAAISAILAAEIGNLDYRPDENLSAKACSRQSGSPFMQFLLRGAPRAQYFGGGHSKFVHSEEK
jgi:hypothetical protein